MLNQPFMITIAMTPKSVLSIAEEEEESNLLYAMSEQRLRKAVSDVSSEMGKLRKELEEAMAKIEEVKQVECECCGLTEDCTPDYIVEVKDSYSDKWLCGLCSEAVKERLIRPPEITMEEAVSSHRDFSQRFNTTTRLNPKLSLTFSMRDIVKKSSQSRGSKNVPASSRLGRTVSCLPRIDTNAN